MYIITTTFCYKLHSIVRNYSKHAIYSKMPLIEHTKPSYFSVWLICCFSNLAKDLAFSILAILSSQSNINFIVANNYIL